MNYHFDGEDHISNENDFGCDTCINFENDDTCHYCNDYRIDCKCEKGCVNFVKYESEMFKGAVFCENFEEAPPTYFDL